MTDAERIKELEKLIEWHKQDTHDAMEWKRELEAEMLNNAKTAQLIIDGLEAKLEKSVWALKDALMLADTRDDNWCSSDTDCLEKTKAVLASLEPKEWA